MRASFGFAFLFVLNSLTPNTALGSVGCKDESGRDVDWFVVYKIPKLENEDAPFNTGYAYAVLTSKDNVKSWKLSTKLINDEKSIFGQNLVDYYNLKPSSGVSYVLYNDQIEGKHSSYFAHAKGLLVMKGQTGFWLTHSIPKFPPAFDTSYDYPYSGSVNGQTAFCVTFSTTNADILAKHLLVIRPNVYSYFLSEDMKKRVPNMQKVINRKWLPDKDAQQTLSSLGNVDFTIFSKSSKSRVDLYQEYIANYMKTDLVAETWRRGSGTPLPSSCSEQYKVNNVNEVSLKFGKSRQAGPWKYLEDHSKWAISGGRKTPAVCFADLNRMQSQFSRGGGAICIKNPDVWKLMHDSVAETEPCP